MREVGLEWIWSAAKRWPAFYRGDFCRKPRSCTAVESPRLCSRLRQAGHGGRRRLRGSEVELHRQPPQEQAKISASANVPGGVSANGRWFEPQMRGAPDIVRLVPTPHDGIPGSKGSMLMQTLWSGVPNRPSFKAQQDDFVADGVSKIGLIPVSRSPSVVVRVYLPPFDKWEKRIGNSFGYRAANFTPPKKTRISRGRHQNEGGRFLARHVHLLL